MKIIFRFSIISVLFFSACTLSGGEVNIPAKAIKSPAGIYKYGVKTSKDGYYEEARKVFNILRKKYPTSLYATTAKLRIADSYKKEEMYATAASRYRIFRRDHPDHEGVNSGYVLYSIAWCNYKLGPGNFFLFPPAYEKDLSFMEVAHTLLKHFIRKYPKSTYLKKAKKLYRKTRKTLVDHELYVARYYEKKEKYKAVKMRYEYLLNKYSDSKKVPEVSLKLSKVYLKLGKKEKAKKLLSAIIEKVKSPEVVKQANALRKSIN
ncbi:MAG: outer membrane protein assembly factor BamD [Deltaproteobacteria bacterium]|jgi:outer membrane protein assembly factor BamD|nr:outer membrane protein assembly factor BamD [Deltaproteobacteria bacterium]